MTMLEGAEFSVGPLGHADGLCLIVPRTEYEELVLVAPGVPRVAIFPDDYPSFRGFVFETNERWSGVIIPNIHIELDLTSMVNVEHRYAPRGAIIRRADYLSVATRIEDIPYRDGEVPLVHGLPPCQEKFSVGFTKWQIVLGEGQAKRVLKTFDVSLPKP